MPPSSASSEPVGGFGEARTFSCKADKALPEKSLGPHAPAMSSKSSGPKRHGEPRRQTVSGGLGNLDGHLPHCCKCVALGGCIVDALGCCAQLLEHLNMLRNQGHAGGVRQLLPALQATASRPTP